MRRGGVHVNRKGLYHLELPESRSSTLLKQKKEMALHLRRCRPSCLPVNISDEEIKVVSASGSTYKYLGMQVDNKLDCSVNCDFLYSEVPSKVYVLRTLASFNVGEKML